MDACLGVSSRPIAETMIIIHTTVPLGRREAWQYYTQPEHITGWNFASDDWQCPWASSDLRAGGKYVARMEAKDGSAGFDFEASFDEIVEGERLSYTIADGRPVQVLFNEQAGATNVTVHFVPENLHPVEMQQAGWQAILDNYGRYCAAQEARG